jgi:hypothetical protein
MFLPVTGKAAGNPVFAQPLRKPLKEHSCWYTVGCYGHWARLRSLYLPNLTIAGLKFSKSGAADVLLFKTLGGKSGDLVSGGVSGFAGVHHREAFEAFLTANGKQLHPVVANLGNREPCGWLRYHIVQELNARKALNKYGNTLALGNVGYCDSFNNRVRLFGLTCQGGMPSTCPAKGR